jgi:curved DNA-binding protein CbpA
MESPHEILGVPAGATAGEIARAYRKLVRRYPPELAPAQFARIQQAYRLLTSLELRIEAARKAPEEALDQLFSVPAARLKAPPPPPAPPTAKSLEPLLAPFRRALLARLLRKHPFRGRRQEP